MRHERLFSSEKLPSPKDLVNNNTSQPVMDKTSLNAKSLKGILNIIAVFYICQPYVKNGKNSSSFFKKNYLKLKAKNTTIYSNEEEILSIRSIDYIFLFSI